VLHLLAARVFISLLRWIVFLSYCKIHGSHKSEQLTIFREAAKIFSFFSQKGRGKNLTRMQ